MDGTRNSSPLKESDIRSVRYLGTPEQLKQYNLQICRQVAPNIWEGKARPGFVMSVPSPRRQLPPMHIDSLFFSNLQEPFVPNIFLDCALVPENVGVEGANYGVIHSAGCSHSWF
jgi:hypothetical protein